MPPVLDPSKSKVDGLAFIGLSLSRNHPDIGHPESVTHQDAFDLNQVQDREYKYIFSTNDDGWLVGGGEPGPPQSYKLAAKDTAHVEILRIGTYRPEWGGLDPQVLIDAIESGKILVPQFEVVPTAVVANPDQPPELEIRFDMEPPVMPSTNDNDADVVLPINWQLRFLHNQLFRHFQFASRFCPGAFHSTILRKAEFRSPQHEKDYFAHCDKVVKEWKEQGPKPLNSKGWNVDGSLMEEAAGTKPEYTSGVFLFTDRQNITHQFVPNFLPPYNTKEKLDVIREFLKDEWDEDTRSWKPLGEMKEMDAATPGEEELHNTKKKVIKKKKHHHHDGDEKGTTTEEQRNRKIHADNRRKEMEKPDPKTTSPSSNEKDTTPTKKIDIAKTPVSNTEETTEEKNIDDIKADDADMVAMAPGLCGCFTSLP